MKTITFAENPKLARVSANAKKKKKSKGGRKVAKRKKLSKAARAKKSRATARRTPRFTSGPKKGQFKPKGSRKAAAKKKPAKKRGRPKSKAKKKKKKKNALVKGRPLTDPNRGKKKKKKNPAHNRARSLLNQARSRVDQAAIAAGTGFAEIGQSLKRSALPVLEGVVAFRADEWFSDDLTRLVGVEQHSAAGKGIRAVVAFALGMGVDLLVRRDGKAIEMRMTTGEWVRNLLITKLLAEVSADFVEPGVLNLTNVPGMRLIVADQTLPALPPATSPTGASGVGRFPRGSVRNDNGFPAGSIRRRTQRPNALGIILERSAGIGVPGAQQN